MNAVFFMSVCKIHEEPVIEDGKVTVGRVMNLNFVIDHRYIDGGKAKQLPKVLNDIFDEPEKYAFIEQKKDQ